MQEHLLNIREAAEYLGLSERKIKEMVDTGRIPAYKIGGSFLRFKKTQLYLLKASIERPRQKPKAAGIPADTPKQNGAEAPNDVPMPVADETIVVTTGADSVRDFLYFNDFYILSIVVIITAVVLMITT